MIPVRLPSTSVIYCALMIPSCIILVHCPESLPQVHTLRVYYHARLSPHNAPRPPLASAISRSYGSDPSRTHRNRPRTRRNRCCIHDKGNCTYGNLSRTDCNASYTHRNRRCTHDNDNCTHRSASRTHDKSSCTHCNASRTRRSVSPTRSNGNCRAINCLGRLIDCADRSPESSTIVCINRSHIREGSGLCEMLEKWVRAP